MGRFVRICGYGDGFLLFLTVSGGHYESVSPDGGDVSCGSADFSDRGVYISFFFSFHDCLFSVSGTRRGILQPVCVGGKTDFNSGAACLFPGSVWESVSGLVLLADFGDLLRSHQYDVFP